MKTLRDIMLLGFGVVAIAGVLVHAQERRPVGGAAQPAVRFAAVDVSFDSGEAALAAYQFELSASSGEFKIVGVEGGEHAAFTEPPYYDPKALSQDRIIIAAFDTGDDLPTGKTRVARIHVEIIGNIAPTFDVQVIVAASADGQSIPVEATHEIALADELPVAPKR